MRKHGINGTDNKKNSGSWLKAKASGSRTLVSMESNGQTCLWTSESRSRSIIKH